MTSSTTTPARDQIAEVVRTNLAQELKTEPSSITDDGVLKDLPGADSIHLLRVVSRLERHWDVEFNDEDIFSSTTFADLVTLVGTYLRADG